MEEKVTVALKALNQAACNEKETRQFYLEAAERTTDQRGREMFLSLAEEEEKHLRIVQAQYETLNDGGEWVVFEETACDVADLEETLLSEGRRALRKEAKPDASDLDALLFGLQIENNSYEFYRKAAAETTESAGKAMYEYLALAERGHFNVLMLNYEHMVNTGTWLGLVGEQR